MPFHHRHHATLSKQCLEISSNQLAQIYVPFDDEAEASLEFRDRNGRGYTLDNTDAVAVQPPTINDNLRVCHRMGPTCEVTLTRLDGELLDEVHHHLESVAEEVVPTRKGRVWDVWVEGRPIHVQADDDCVGLLLAAGCNQTEDWAVIERLAMSLANALGGKASRPEK